MGGLSGLSFITMLSKSLVYRRCPKAPRLDPPKAPIVVQSKPFLQAWLKQVLQVAV